MLKLFWEDMIGSNEEAVRIINLLELNLEIHKNQDKNIWFVYLGEKLHLETDDKEDLDAYLHGFALAYYVLPKEVIRDYLDEWL